MFRKAALTIARYTIAVSSIVLPGKFVSRNTEGFTTMPEKEIAVSDTNYTANGGLEELTEQGQSRFREVVVGYHDRKSEMIGDTITYTPEECHLMDCKINSYKILERCDDKMSGFYGIAYKDVDNNKTILVLTGMNFSSGLPALFADADDALLSAAGGEISQLAPALKFTKHIEDKYGVDHLTGHSLGGYLTIFMKGMGLCKNADTWVYDCAGVQNVTVDYCAEKTKRPREEVVQDIKRNMHSFTITHNLYNNIGQQPGLALTVNNERDNPLSLFPRDHIPTEEFINKVLGTQKFIPRENDQDSNARNMVALGCVLVAYAALRKELKEARKKIKDLLKKEPDLTTAYEKLTTNTDTRTAFRRIIDERLHRPAPVIPDNEHPTEVDVFPVIMKVMETPSEWRKKITQGKKAVVDAAHKITSSLNF